jgi:hypothetical protein
MRKGTSPEVVRGWNGWKKRMNWRYSGIFWSARPIDKMEMNLVMLNRIAVKMTGDTWRKMIILEP